jgi:hypothetical protein
LKPHIVDYRWQIDFEFSKFAGECNASWNLRISGFIAQPSGEVADECIDIALMG